MPNPACYNCGEAATVTNADGEIRWCTDCADDTPNSPGSRCGNCSGIVNYTTETHSGARCASCYSTGFYTCADCGCEANRNSGGPFTINNYHYCRECHERRDNQNQTADCYSCGDSISDENRTRSPSGDMLCICCYEQMYADCDICGDLTDRRHLHHQGPSFVCDGCYEDPHWSSPGFYVENPTYDKVVSKRRYGIELETHACDNHMELKGETAFGCKKDGSVDGKEFVSPVFFGDGGFDEVDKLCQFARDNNWELNSSTGYHVHCDMSDETTETCQKVAIAYHYTYDLWFQFFSNSRKRNYYCARNDWSPNEILEYRSFGDFVRDYVDERYCWLNLASYLRFGTFEVRLHSGTLNATKVKNWVKAHLMFIDAVKELTLKQVTDMFADVDVSEQFKALAELWDDVSLTEYYYERAAHFSHTLKPVSTVQMANELATI